MRKEDLDKIITAAVNVANENASVYGSQITKDHKDKIIFRPDSYIKLAADPPVTDPVDETKTPVPPPIEETKTPADDSEKKTTLNAPGGSAAFKKLNMDWQNAITSDEMFLRFYKAVFEAYGADLLYSIGFYSIDDVEGKPKPLNEFQVWGFAHKLEPNLRRIKFTTEFGVGTVSQGERGGEKIMSLYDLIYPDSNIDLSKFPHYKLKIINALLQINAEIRQKILLKDKPQSLLEKARDKSGWWGTVLDTLANTSKGIQESLISGK